MSKNLHKRLRELQKVAALHQNQASTPIGVAAQSFFAKASEGLRPVGELADTNSVAAVSDANIAATMAIGTPEHYKIIRRDLVFVMILIIVMIGLLFGLSWLTNNTALAQWIVNLGSSIR